MRLVDLSHTLNSSISVYPDDPSFFSSPFATIAKDGANVHSLSLGSHTGTHIDAPYHFVHDGKRVDQLPLEWLVGEALVIDVSHRANDEPYAITWKDLEAREREMSVLGQKGEGGMVLIRTGWDKYWGTEKYLAHPYLTKEAATRIVETGIRVLGVDTLNPDQTLRLDDHDHTGAQAKFDVHEVVLGSGCVIAENLTNLAALCSHPEKTWIVSLVPLKLEGCDGSPVRAYASVQ
jgi:kynurenine formamidase